MPERFVAVGGIAELLSSWWNDEEPAPAGKPKPEIPGQGTQAPPAATGPGIFTRSGTDWTSSDREPVGPRLPEEKTSWWDDFLAGVQKLGSWQAEQTPDYPWNPSAKNPLGTPKPTGRDQLPGPVSFTKLGGSGGLLVIALAGVVGYYVYKRF